MRYLVAASGMSGVTIGTGWELLGWWIQCSYTASRHVLCVDTHEEARIALEGQRVVDGVKNKHGSLHIETRDVRG